MERVSDIAMEEEVSECIIWIGKWWQRRNDLLHGELVDGFGSLPLYEQLVTAHALLVSYFPK